VAESPPVVPVLHTVTPSAVAAGSALRRFAGGNLKAAHQWQERRTVAVQTTHMRGLGTRASAGPASVTSGGAVR
jgi:hypothetical protein